MCYLGTDDDLTILLFKNEDSFSSCNFSQAVALNISTQNPTAAASKFITIGNNLISVKSKQITSKLRVNRRIKNVVQVLKSELLLLLFLLLL